MPTTPSDNNLVGNSPEFWQLNFMHGTFTDPKQIEDTVRNYATAENPRLLATPRIALPTSRLHLQIPLNRKLRSEHESELYIELSGCIFVATSVLEAMHRHEKTTGYRTFHTLDYRKARLEREITIRPDEVTNYADSCHTSTFSALGSLLLPKTLSGQVTADAAIPEKINGARFSYEGRLANNYVIYGGFHQPNYE